MIPVVFVTVEISLYNLKSGVVSYKMRFLSFNEPGLRALSFCVGRCRGMQRPGLFVP